MRCTDQERLRYLTPQFCLPLLLAYFINPNRELFNFFKKGALTDG